MHVHSGTLTVLHSFFARALKRSSLPCPHAQPFTWIWLVTAYAHVKRQRKAQWLSASLVQSAKSPCRSAKYYSMPYWHTTHTDWSTGLDEVMSFMTPDAWSEHMTFCA